MDLCFLEPLACLSIIGLPLCVSRHCSLPPSSFLKYSPSPILCVCVCCRFHICQFAKLMSVESVIPPNSLILSHTLLLLPSIFSSIRVFFNESALHITWSKYWSFSISLSNEYSGLISFKIDWFDLVVQGTLKSLLQRHNSKASIL